MIQSKNCQVSTRLSRATGACMHRVTLCYLSQSGKENGKFDLNLFRTLKVNIFTLDQPVPSTREEECTATWTTATSLSKIALRWNNTGCSGLSVISHNA